MTNKMQIHWTTVFTESDTAPGDFNPCTQWVSTEDIFMGRMTFEVQNSTDATGVMTPALQVANVPNTISSTDSWPSGGPDPSLNTETGNGLSFPNGFANLGAVVQGYQLVRFGFYFKASGAGSTEQARVSALIEIKTC